ncbi:hypothetical protein V6N13_042630 [Hibiscus sabdariffa]
MSKPPSTVDPRFPKKQRRRDEAPRTATLLPSRELFPWIEKSSELDPNLADTPAPHRPLEPYGPWMLVENRRRRPTKSASQLNQSMSPRITTTTRYNPIYVENDPAIATSVSADVSPTSDIQPAPPTPVLNQDTVVPHPCTPANSGTVFAPNGKSKLKGNTQVVPRKPSSIVLRQRDINVMPRKAPIGVVSTTSASKKSSLDTSKHSALTTLVSASPVVITCDNQ